MTRSIRDISIAFAGICQGAALADRMAAGSPLDSAALNSTVGSVLKLDPESTIDVFGSVSDLQVGIRAAIGVLRQSKDMHILKYVIQLIVLQRKLSNKRQLNRELTQRIDALVSDIASQEMDGASRNREMADIYKSTISKLRPRILIKGEASILQREQNIATIRSLLLGGIRAAVLWRQCGGSRLTLLLKRKQILTQLHYLLQE